MAMIKFENVALLFNGASVRLVQFCLTVFCKTKIFSKKRHEKN